MKKILILLIALIPAFSTFAQKKAEHLIKRRMRINGLEKPLDGYLLDFHVNI